MTTRARAVNVPDLARSARFFRASHHALSADRRAACPCRELLLRALVMQSAEDRPRSKLAEPLDRPLARRTLSREDAFGVRCDSQCRQQGFDASGRRRRRRYGRGIPCGSSRPVSPHARSARVSARPSGDRVSSWPQDASRPPDRTTHHGLGSGSLVLHPKGKVSVI